MEYLYSRLRSRKLDERGINMVDLMMWLVIASLLLAAALQGIGYYRQSADLYTMKSDAMHAGEAVSAKASQNGGQYTVQTVSDATNDSAKSPNVTLTPDAGASDGNGYVIRATHPEVTDKDVLFLSNQRGTYPPGVNVVPKGTVIAPDGSTSIPSAAPSGGTGTGTTFTPIVANATCDAVTTRFFNADLAFSGSSLALAGDIAYSIGDNTTGAAKYAELYASPIGVEYNSALTDEANYEWSILTSRQDAGIPALNDAMNTASSNYYGAVPATADLQQAYTTALNNLYTATCAAPFDMTPYYLVGAPSFPANFTDVTITPGTHDVVFKVALPASYTGSLAYANPVISTKFGVVGSADATQYTDGTTTYWKFTYSGNNGSATWVTGTTRVVMGITGVGQTYYKAFNVTVQ